MLTMYKKHRAFVLTPKFCVYLLSPPNIKFGIFNIKDKYKILYLAKCLTRKGSSYPLPYVSYTNRCSQLKSL